MKFTFNKTWQDAFGDAIEAVKDKIGDNRYHFSYGSPQWAQDYQFSKLPTKDMNYVKMLKVIADNPMEIRVWRDVVKRTNPDKADMKGWGNTTCAYLKIAGMIEKNKLKGYVLTPLGKAVVDYCFKNK